MLVSGMIGCGLGARSAESFLIEMIRKARTLSGIGERVRVGRLRESLSAGVASAGIELGKTPAKGSADNPVFNGVASCRFVGFLTGTDPDAFFFGCFGPIPSQLHLDGLPGRESTGVVSGDKSICCMVGGLPLMVLSSVSLVTVSGDMTWLSLVTSSSSSILAAKGIDRNLVGEDG